MTTKINLTAGSRQRNTIGRKTNLTAQWQTGRTAQDSTKPERGLRFAGWWQRPRWSFDGNSRDVQAGGELGDFGGLNGRQGYNHDAI